MNYKYQCDDCDYSKIDENHYLICTHPKYLEVWDGLHTDIECKGYYSRDDAQYDAKIRYAERG